MSIEALSWAFKLELAPASMKLLLIAFCDCADHSGYAYPSYELLQQRTSLDRKTILKCVEQLRQQGLLEDTGRRVGPTHRVIVHRVRGIPHAEQVHYTYKVTDPETGRFYLGKRSFSGDPASDTYRGSGKWVRDMVAEGRLLIREVIETWTTVEEALAHEQRLFRQHQNDPLCMNLGTPARNAERSKNLIVPKTELSQISDGTVPNFPANGPVFPREQSQKRSSEPSVTVNGTINEPPSEVQPGLSVESWQAFKDHRREIKQPLTKRAEELALRKLALFHVRGIDVDECINQSILSGWSGLFEPKEARKGTRPKSRTAAFMEQIHACTEVIDGDAERVD